MTADENVEHLSLVLSESIQLPPNLVLPFSWVRVRGDRVYRKCQINGIPAFRIRPCHFITGHGGHGDHVLEISNFDFIPECKTNSKVQITLFRELD